ncbi:MAG: hypothetical protein ACXAB2_15150, partial [Candidatus Hodarchaeales archaeon]
YVNGTISLRSDKELRTITHLLENPGRTSDTDSKNIRLGADANLAVFGGIFSGEIAEIIVYNRVLTDTEIDSVEGYLEKKWKYNESKIVIPTETSTTEDNVSKSEEANFQISNLSILMILPITRILRTKFKN